MLKALLDRQALRGVYLKDLLDEVLGSVGNVIPVRRRKGVVASFDLLEENCQKTFRRSSEENLLNEETRNAHTLRKSRSVAIISSANRDKKMHKRTCTVQDKVCRQHFLCFLK